MQAEHQVVEKGVFFRPAIKLDESLGARWGAQRKGYLASAQQGGIDLGKDNKSN